MYRCGMETFSTIIGLWPNRSQLAEDLDTTYGVVKQWDRRNSIPPEYWLRLVVAAKKRDIEGVTLERLAEIAEASGRDQVQTTGAD